MSEVARRSAGPGADVAAQEGSETVQIDDVHHRSTYRSNMPGVPRTPKATLDAVQVGHLDISKRIALDQALHYSLDIRY